MIQYPTLMAVVGNICLIATLLLIGPVPFLTQVITISFNYECGLMVVFGVGYSLIMVSAYGRAIKAITNLGYDIDTTATVLITGIACTMQNYICPIFFQKLN